MNGLSVINLGDYSFGKPCRVTASVGIGASGIVNIERESKLSGQTYDKAILILDGYLRNKYAKDHALALSAGITMEQSYGFIEGDSASVAELICLLSAIADIPLRQDIAVTGSADKRLRKMVAILKEERPSEPSHTSVAPEPHHPGQRDPRPPLPGRDRILP